MMTALKRISGNWFILLNLAICAFGVQFVQSMQVANATSIFNFLGADSNILSFLWLTAPITGMIVQPIIGQLSDLTWTKYGKRNPYILVASILSSVSLLGIAFAPSVFAAATAFWVFGCMINVCMETMRALTSDLIPSSQKATAFSAQSVASGVGAGLAAIMPWLLEELFSFTKVNGVISGIPLSLKLSYVFGAIILVLCAGWQVSHTKEKAATKRQLLASVHARLLESGIAPKKRTPIFFLERFIATS